MKKQLLSGTRRLTPEEIALNRWQIEERIEFGIVAYLDKTKEFFKTHITEFNSYEEYYEALSQAELFIIEGKTVEEPMRSKLIAVRKKLEENNLVVYI